jgi:protein TonB
MEQPTHDLRSHAPGAAANTGRRTIILAAVALLHVGLVWALISGLAAGLIEKLPEELKAEVVQPKDETKPPPPPPPELQKPPPPFVPPPEINIATDAPVTNAITAVQAVQPTVVVAPPAITSPASIGSPHQCGQKYYPSLSVRLQEQGTTGVGFDINPDGSVSSPHIEAGSGYQRLDDATLTCVVNWHYKPAMQNGQPIKVPWHAKVAWTLK